VQESPAVTPQESPAVTPQESPAVTPQEFVGPPTPEQSAKLLIQEEFDAMIRERKEKLRLENLQRIQSYPKDTTYLVPQAEVPKSEVPQSEVPSEKSPMPTKGLFRAQMSTTDVHGPPAPPLTMADHLRFIDEERKSGFKSRRPTQIVPSGTISPGAVSGQGQDALRKMIKEQVWYQLVSSSEGLRLKAYKDKSGKWTIGKGSTIHPDGRPVRKGDIIAAEDVDIYMNHHVESLVLPQMVKIPTWSKMDRNQQAAIISFAYNVGQNFYGLKKFETITKALSDVKNWPTVPHALTLYNKGEDEATKKMVVMAGLITRRKDEGILWKEPVDLYGKRRDGSLKGVGWAGEQHLKDGTIITEYSITVGMEIDGKTVGRDIPSLYYGITAADIKIVLDAAEKKEMVPQAIVEKAKKAAQKRIAQGLDPFYNAPAK